ncbi:MAG: hypothetical protein ACT4N5_01685 [Nitrosopumilaceae archaeon]
MYPLIDAARLYDELALSSERIKWSWACRILDKSNLKIDTSLPTTPRAGDIVLVRVEQIGYHKSIIASSNKKLRIYDGDLIMGIFGNRYATNALEGVVEGFENLSILTAGGMIGTVKSKHQDFGKTTNVSFIGFLNDKSNHRVNLKELKFHKSKPVSDTKNLIVLVGTGMNTGKTTSVRMLIRGLSKRDLKIAACKLTGSVSNRDADEMRSASASCTIDFSDYGFPSTYLCDKEELLDLFNNMLSDVEKLNPDATVMEIADGILQRETMMLLEDPSIKKRVKGIILTAESAPSALYGVDKLKKLGYNIIGVSGAMTSSPLFVKEFRQNCEVRVASSVDSADELVEIVHKAITMEN